MAGEKYVGSSWDIRWASLTLIAILIGCNLHAAHELIYAIDTENNLISFFSDSPGTILDSRAITGLQPAEHIIGLDYGPDGKIYGLGSSSRLYTINPATGAATQVGSGQFSTLLDGLSFGCDVGPTGFRVVSGAGTANPQHLLISTTTGAATVGPSPSYAAGDPLFGQEPFIDGIAYDVSFDVWYAADSLLNIFATFDPATGLLHTIGPSGIDFSRDNGFDISQATGIAYLASPAASSDPAANLYTVNKTTGAVTLVGLIGNPDDNILIQGLAVLAEQVNFLVINTHDDGVGSLRRAIVNAAGRDHPTVTFAVTGTITLTSGELDIANNLSIAGPGANLVTVDGNGANRVFVIKGGTVSISGLTITNGNGGIYNTNAMLSVGNCVICGHTGHGVYNAGGGMMTLNNCTISSNALPAAAGVAAGGGVFNAFDPFTPAVLNMTNCTVSWNSANGNGGTAYGGGIFNGGSLTIMSSTICSNSCVSSPDPSGYCYGGGIYRYGGTVAVGNCIVAANDATSAQGTFSPDYYGSVSSWGYNLIGAHDGSGPWSGPGDQVGSMASPLGPELGPLRDNGGGLPTHALLADSPAINAGTNFGVTTDQRGFARPYHYPGIPNAPGGDGSDIGAFELQPVTWEVTSLADDGPGTLRHILAQANSGDGVMFATNGTIILSSGELDIGTSLTIVAPGPTNVVLSGNGSSLVLVVTNCTVSLSGLTISNGVGGIWNSNAALWLSNCVITGNQGHSSAANAGPALFNDLNGEVVMNDCTICSNSIISPASVPVGAGIRNWGTLLMTNCTVSANQLSSPGGAVGAGVANQTPGTMTMICCTVVSNSAGGSSEAGGITMTHGSSIGNSIVAGNMATTQPDVFGPPSSLTSLGCNLIGATNGLTGWKSTDLVGSAALPLNALLGPLQDNGGGTPTHAPLPGSPAIDAGTSFGTTTDERGQLRPIVVSGIVNGGDGSDIGAFEVATPKLTITFDPQSDTVTVSWPSPLTGFGLQQTGNPADPNGWSGFSGTPNDDHTTKSVTITPPTGNVFFRLKK